MPPPFKKKIILSFGIKDQFSLNIVLFLTKHFDVYWLYLVLEEEGQA